MKTKIKLIYDGWLNWITERHDADRDCNWFWFSLNPHKPAEFATDQIIQRWMRESCDAVTSRCDVAFSRNNQRRYPVAKAVRMLLLPATKNDTFHAHGWGCLPRVTTTRRRSIFDKRARRIVTMPENLALLVDEINSRPPLQTVNLHICNDGQSVIPETQESLAKHIGYLRPSGIERREWTRLFAQPHWKWKQQAWTRAAHTNGGR